MDTIDSITILKDVADLVEEHRKAGHIIHTVLVTLNGQHGGADVRLQGFTDDTLDTELDRTVEVR